MLSRVEINGSLSKKVPVMRQSNRDTILSQYKYITIPGQTQLGAAGSREQMMTPQKKKKKVVGNTLDGHLQIQTYPLCLKKASF